MTDTITLVWQGQSFQSSTSTSTSSTYHLTGTNMTVDWGDGTTETITSNKRFTHSYSSSGTYTITITGDSITNFGYRTFYGCVGLKSIIIPSSITTLSGNCFQNCTRLTNITIPSSVTTLEDNCFYGCTSLTNITIPSSVTTIKNNCFYNCTGLTSITILSGVTSLESSCFYGCTGLTNIIFINPIPPTVSNVNAWTNLPTSCKIYVPEGSLSAYTSASNYPSSSTYTYIERDMIEMEKAQVVAKEIFNALYPVGSIYMSVTDDNPADLFGGAWEQIKDRFLLSSGSASVESIGGEANHTLSVAEMPSHTHLNHNWTMIVSSGANTGTNNLNVVSSGGGFNIAKNDRDYNTVRFTTYIGGGQAHNNMPPYTVVYIWRRLA